jgi:hypothetical protein
MMAARAAAFALLLLAAVVAAYPAAAEEIDAAQYGSSTSGFPYAIALEKGFSELHLGHQARFAAPLGQGPQGRPAGAITGEVDVKTMVDDSFLPADLHARSL